MHLNTNIRFSVKLWLFNCTQQIEYFCQETKLIYGCWKERSEKTKQANMIQKLCFYSSRQPIVAAVKAKQQQQHFHCSSSRPIWLLINARESWDPIRQGKSLLLVQVKVKCYSTGLVFLLSANSYLQTCANFNSPWVLNILQISFFSPSLQGLSLYF